MKRIILFSRYFVPAAVISLILAVFGIVGYFTKGFNKGVDFQAGLLQEIQFAPTAFSLTYTGPGTASVSLGRSAFVVVVTGAAIEEVTHTFSFAAYPSQGDLARGLRAVEGIAVSETAPASIRSEWLVQSTRSSPRLEPDIPFSVHYLPPDAVPVSIEEVRSSLLPLGTVAVQVLGTPGERRFMIRMEHREILESGGASSERIVTALENTFGNGEVALTRSDFVHERFSRQLSSQAGILLVMTLLLILVYCSFRFKPQYAIGAVLAIIHDGLIMVAFVVWTRMEFNTTTIAAILTILGYSINDTIVIFDRIKETRQIYPDDSFVDILNRAISETLGRTIITTVTTMLAVVSLFIFTTGSMKDFALALLVGMVSGVYSTIFIASGFVNFWQTRALKREKQKLAAVHAKD